MYYLMEFETGEKLSCAKDTRSELAEYADNATVVCLGGCEVVKSIVVRLRKFKIDESISGSKE